MVGHAIAVRATFEREPELERGDSRRSRPSRGSCSTRCRRRCTTPGATRSRSGGSAATSGDPHSLNLFVVGDNLLKGAALNAVQIAELLVARGLPAAAAVAAGA